MTRERDSGPTLGCMDPAAPSHPAPASAPRAETWAFWLGVSSLTCLGPLTGLLAVAMGAVLLSRAPRGARPPLALAGVLAGAFGTAAGLLVLVLGASIWQRRAEHRAVVASAAPVVLAPAELPEPRDPPGTSRPSLPPGHPPIGPAEEADPPTAAQSIGTLTLVQVSSEDRRSLATVLRTVRHDHDPLLVYVRAPRCAPCSRFESALGAPAMQTALGKSVLVAVDATYFESELHALRIDTRDVPTFVRLADAAEPIALDAITGIEWDADTPANMAPVFTRFLAGTLQKRRQPPPFVGTSL